MVAENLLGKKILIVDDEPDVLEVLEELLSMCDITKAATFNEAKKVLESNTFDIVILDIMGVNGYELLEIANNSGMDAVMLTAHAMSPENIEKSYVNKAASFVPKEKISDIAVFLNDILEGKRKGKSLWWRWRERLEEYCEKKFGPDWQKEYGIKVNFE